MAKMGRWSKHRDRASALSEAKRLRDMGFKAKVVTISSYEVHSDRPSLWKK